MALPQQPPDLFSETESGKKHLESNLELEAQRGNINIISGSDKGEKEDNELVAII